MVFFVAGRLGLSRPSSTAMISMCLPTPYSSRAVGTASLITSW